MMTDGSANGDADVARLAAEWRTAETTVRRLEREAPYPSDPPDLRKPGDDIVADAAQLGRDPLFKPSFGVARTTIQFVRLDRLIVFQRFINVSYVAILADRFARHAGDRALFRACLSLR